MILVSGVSFRFLQPKKPIGLALFFTLAALWNDASVPVLAQSSSSSSSSNNTSFKPRCGVEGKDAGACWCVPPGGISEGSCPSISPGIRQSFPSDWSDKLKTFRLVANISSNSSPRPAISPPSLTATAGSDSQCYAFAKDVGQISNFPQTDYPQCIFPTTPMYANGTNATAPVCAYKYDSSQSCRGRDYQIITYVDKATAEAAGAIMVHTGICGVCSTAQDLAARMSTLPQFNPLSIVCGVNYFQTQDFAGLVSCYTQLGFSTPCATLWAQFSSTSTRLCTSECTPVNNVVQLNEPPPNCTLAPCPSCSLAKFENSFNALAGITKSAFNAGFNDDIAYPCSYYTRIDNFDPCQDAAPTTNPAPTPAPGPTAPSTGGGGSKSAASPPVAVKMVVGALDSTPSQTMILTFLMLVLGGFV